MLASSGIWVTAAVSDTSMCLLTFVRHWLFSDNIIYFREQVTLKNSNLDSVFHFASLEGLKCKI